ncbi:15702_t:CDS:2 [Funneliformis geosporum]|nr:15702_t:CDS:2 [Funneliformis geosporum]
MNSQNSTIHIGTFGRIPYVDPKKLLDLNFQYEKASDIYSYGVLMWEISSGIPPFKKFTSKCDQELLYFNIPKGFRENNIKGTPEDYRDLYEKCWDSIPDNRPSIKKVLEEFKKMGYGIDEKDEEDNSTYEGSPMETETNINNILSKEMQTTNDLNRQLNIHDDLNILHKQKKYQKLEGHRRIVGIYLNNGTLLLKVCNASPLQLSGKNEPQFKVCDEYGGTLPDLLTVKLTLILSDLESKRSRLPYHRRIMIS